MELLTRHKPAGNIICPNPHCGYRGPPQEVKKGSTVIAVILLLLWILPGVIYLIFMNGYHCDCPACGMRIK